MMKKKVLLMGMVCVVSLACFTGCNGTVNDGENTTEESVIKEEETMAQETTEEVTEGTTQEQVHDLSSQEIKEFENLLNSIEYNGFALIQFQDPTEIEWDMVCYNGAGIQMEGMSNEQADAYLKAANMEEIFTDVTAIAASDLEAFVERTTGTKYGEAKKPLTWAYVADYDFYGFMHGDTNYLSVSDISGQCQGDEYILRYSIQGCSEDMENHVLTLKKNGEEYLFLSNVIGS